MKWIWRFFLISVGFLILFWSLVLAGFEKLKIDIRENNLRTVPIEYVKEFDNGEKIKKIYKVPESHINPNELGYSIKKLRDQLWILMSKTPREKAEVYLLMADKRLFETLELIKKNKSDDLVFKTLNDSIYNLMEARKYTEGEKKDVVFFKVKQAGLAYEDIVKSLNYKNEKIEKIINEIEIWNKKNEK